MYKLSRYWNRLAYAIMKLGRKMIWDYTGKNGFLLDDSGVFSETAESIMCDRSFPFRLGY